MNALIATACFFTSFVVIATLNWLDLIPWRKTAGAHWTERSRALWPVRKNAALLTLYVPLLVAAGSSLLWKCSMPVLVTRWLPALAGAIAGRWFLTKEIFPGLQLRPWLHDVTVGTTLRLGIWVIFIAIGFAMPDRFGVRSWLLLGAAVLLQILWLPVVLWLLRLSGLLKPVGERLRRIVADCTADGGPRVRGLWQAKGMMANALALPLTGTLVFLDPLPEILTDDEVAAVCAHEIGHLAESKRILICRYLGSMALLPFLLMKPVVLAWGTGGMLVLALVVVFWARLARRLIRSMETRADEVARRSQTGEGVYARALEKIYQNNRLPAVLPGKNMTHPHLYDRMIAAGVTPGFPRPLPPARFNLLGWVFVLAGPMVLVWMLMTD